MNDFAPMRNFPGGARSTKLDAGVMVKTLKILLRDGWTDFHKTWYVASGTPAHYSLFKC